MDCGQYLCGVSKFEMMEEIRFDKRNYRRHSDKNKEVIRRSLMECGAGRSVVIDRDGELIAGNGVYEQAKKLGIKPKIVETDGSELVVVRRTDLGTEDEKRKRLAMADNAAGDAVDWDADLLRADFSVDELADFGIKFKDGDGAKEETMFEAPLQLLPSKEYILVLCEPEEFDEARQHFGCGFVMDTKAGKKYAKPVKSRTVNYRDYVNSHSKQEQTVSE